MPPALDQTMEQLNDKQPIKWMDLPIMKFNEIAVPHHVTQLKALKIKIQKCQRAGDWAGAHREQMNATVVVKQLRTLVKEMDTLRNRVIDSDVHKFDRMINSSRQAALNILQEFKDLSQQLPMFPDEEANSNKDNDDAESLCNDEQLQISRLAVEYSKQAAECRQQEKCAIAWENLQQEIEEVQQLYGELAEVVHSQGETTAQVEKHIEIAHEEVVQGEKHLLQAVQYKAASYPIYGALVGTCLGGPVGFVAGLKIGGLCALTGSLLGFTGGKMLKERQS